MFAMGLKASLRSHGCLVSTSFHMDVNDADHSWQLTQPTCRAFSILKIMQSPLSVQKPPAVLGLSEKQVHFVSPGIFLPAVSATPGNTAQNTKMPSRASGKALMFLGNHTPGWHCQHHHPAPSLYSWAPKLSPCPFFPPFTSPSLSLAQQCKFWGVRAS